MPSHLDRALAELEQEREALDAQMMRLMDQRNRVDFLIQEVKRLGDQPGDNLRVVEVKRSKGRSGPSLRATVVAYLRQYPNGATPRQITEALARQGDPRIRMDKKDPTSNVRTALLTAAEAGEIRKADDGTWRIVDEFVGDKADDVAGSVPHRVDAYVHAERRLMEAFPEAEPLKQ